MRIQDRVFVVTGGGNGIGREVVLELLGRGGRVAAVDLREDGLARTEAVAAAQPGRLTLHQVDVTDRSAVDALVAAVLASHGQVDAVLNVAGIVQRFVPVEELAIEEIDRVMSVNFGGTLNMVKAFLPELRRRPEAALVNVSSMGALVPVPGQGAYGASKGAVKLLTETLFAELRGTGIAVTIVFPGGIGTDILANSGVELPQMTGTSAMKTTPAPQAARQIVDAVASGRFRVVIGRDARMLDLVARVAPTRAITIVADRMRRMLGI